MAKINAQRHVSGTLQAQGLGPQSNKAVDPNSADNCSLWADFTDTSKVKTTGSDPGNQIYKVEDKSRQGNDPVHSLFSPTDLANCSLWLDADDASSIVLNGTGTLQWQDKSGNGNHFGQATAANQPIYSGSVINGRSVIATDGASVQMRLSCSSTTDMVDGSNHYTNIAVIRQWKDHGGGGDVDISNYFGFGGTNSTNYGSQYVHLQIRNAGELKANYNGSTYDVSVTYPGGNTEFRASPQMITNRSYSSGTELRITGTFGALDTTGNPTINADGWAGLPNIYDVSSRRSSWYIAEIIHYARGLTDAECATVETYLQNKWNITVATQSAEPTLTSHYPNHLDTEGFGLNNLPSMRATDTNSWLDISGSWTSGSNVTGSTAYGVFRKYENSGNDYLLSYGEKKIRTSGSNLQWVATGDTTLQASSSLSTGTDYLVTVTEETPAFSPTDIVSCSLWLDADDASSIILNGSDVSQWQDKSGKGNHFSQGTATRQPAYITSGSPFSPRSTIKTDPNTQTYLWAAGTTDLATTVGSDEHITVFSVAKYNSHTSWATQWTFGRSSLGSSGGNYIMFYHGDGAATYMSLIGGTMTNIQSAVLPTSNIWTVRANADGAIIRNSGSVAASTPDPIGSSFAGTGFHVLGDSYSSNRSSYDYAEFIVYNRGLTDAECAQVETYLQNKWDITVATQSYTEGNEPVSSMYLNGVLEQHSTAINSSNTLAYGSIGGSGSSGGNFAGNIGEIVMYDPPVTSWRDRTKVERYLADKYNINYTGFQPDQITASIDATGNSDSKLVLWLDASDQSTVTETVVEAWEPTDVTGCYGWYDASDAASITLDGSTIQQWNDKSGNDNHVSQSTAGNQPLYDTVNTQNGKAVVRFIDQTGSLQGSGSTMPNNATSVFLVATLANSSSWATDPIYSLAPISLGYTAIEATNGFALYYYNDAYWWSNLGQGRGALKPHYPQNSSPNNYLNHKPTHHFGDDKYYIWAFRGQDDLQKTNVSGDLSETTTVNFTTDYTPGNGIQIGDWAQYSGVRGFSGSIAEVIIYDRYVTDAERATIDTYLQNKWNITVATQSSDVTPYSVGISNWSSKVGSISATQTSASYRPTTGSIDGKKMIFFSGSSDSTAPYLEITGAAVAWEPTDIVSCSLWLDADDASSMTISGSNISEWRNKSVDDTGLFDGVQSNSSYQPTTVASEINGRSVVRFDGSDDKLDFSGSTSRRAPSSTGGEITSFIVMKKTAEPSPSATEMMMAYGLDSSFVAYNTDRVALWYDRNMYSPSYASMIVYVNTGWGITYDANSTSPSMFSFARDTSSHQFYHTGSHVTAVSDVETTLNPGVFYPPSSDAFYGRYGAFDGGTMPFYGDIAELICYSRKLSTTERATVETYLQNKWNITVATQSADPVLNTNNTYDVPTPPSLDFVAGTDAYTIFVAHQQNSGSGYDTLIGSGPQYALSYDRNNALLKSDFGTGTVSGSNTHGSTFHLASSLTSTTLNKVYVTGTLSATGAIGSAVTGSSAVHIGAQEISSSNITNRLQSGSIGEILVYSGSLTNFERKQVEEYLYNKWEIETSASY